MFKVLNAIKRFFYGFEKHSFIVDVLQKYICIFYLHVRAMKNIGIIQKHRAVKLKAVIRGMMSRHYHHSTQLGWPIRDCRGPCGPFQCLSPQGATSHRRNQSEN